MEKQIYVFYDPFEEYAVKIGVAHDMEARLDEFSKSVPSSYFVISCFDIPDNLSDSDVIHFITDRHPKCRVVKIGKSGKLYESEYFDLTIIPINVLIYELERFIDEYQIDTLFYKNYHFIKDIQEKIGAK